MTGIVRVSYSQISTFRQCPLKWELQSLERLAPPADKPQLALGSAVHAILEGHYTVLAHGTREGWPEADLLSGARDAAGLALETAMANGLPDDLAERASWIYGGYVQQYGVDSDWEVLSIEQAVDVPLYRGVRFTGRIDLVVRERSTGRVWVVDFKTGAGKDASGAAWTREQDLDDQFGLYQHVVTNKLPARDRLPVFGTIYALIRSDRLQRAMTLEERFGRYRMFRSEQTLDAIWSDAVLTARAMGRARTNWTAGRPTYSAPDPQQCGWKCSFVDTHLMARATGQADCGGRPGLRIRSPGAVGREASVKPGDADAALSVRADQLKGLRESLCRAQSAVGARHVDLDEIRTDLNRIEVLVMEIDRHRPLGPDGRHGNRHTPTCGCADSGFWRELE